MIALVVLALDGPALERAEAEAKVAAERRARRRTVGLALALLLGGASIWLLFDQRAATQRTVAHFLERGRGLLEEGWEEHDLGKLIEAKAEAERAVDSSRRVWAGKPVQEETDRFKVDVEDRLTRAKKNRKLLDALLEVSAPPETRAYRTDASGHMVALAQPSVDEQYATAFRRWGLDVDSTAETEVIARLSQEPDVVVQEVIAGLDSWMLNRLPQKRPEAAWRSLYRITEQMDRNARRGQLRGLMWEKSPTPEAAAALLGTGSPWPVLWELARGRHWRRVQELHSQMELSREPVGTVVLLSKAYLATGDRAAAVEVLRQAAELRPSQLVLLQVLALLLEEQQRWEEAIGCYRAIRVRRPELGIGLARALLQVARKGEGETVLRELIRHRPHDPELHYYLGVVLQGKGQVEEAIQQYRQAIVADLRFAATHNNLGNLLEAKGQVDEALGEYRRAIDLDPELAPAHHNLGNVLKAKGRLDEAIQHFHRAIDLDPKLAPSHHSLGYILMDKGELDKAIILYRKAIDLDPAYAAAHTNLGVALADKGRLDEAIHHFRRAIDLDPKDALAPYNNLGNALYTKGQFDDAIAAHSKAIALDPNLAEPYNGLGAALHRKGRLEEAIAAFRQAIVRGPRFAGAHTNLGLALEAKGHLDEAIQHHRQAIDIDRRLALAYTNLGNALEKKGQLDEAINLHLQALDLDPKLAPAHHNLGNVLKAKGRLDEAIHHYRRAIDLDPKLAPSHHSLGYILMDKGELDKAIILYRKAIDLDPAYAAAHTNLGVALAAKGRLDEAIHHYRRAIDLDPKFAQAYYNLGNALKAKEQLDQAIQAYSEAIDLDPELAEAHCNLGLALQQQSRFREALAALRHGHELGISKARWPYRSADWVRDCQLLTELDSRLPAILKGDDPPRRSEQLALAQLCQQYKHLYVASARYYVQAFADQPRLAEDLSASHRYNAACAAALAASGQGKDAAKLGDKDKARLRKQVLDWLRAELEAWTKVVDKGSPKERAMVQRTLMQWQKDRDLAGLRDEIAVANLPDAEREACRQLWERVTALAAKAAAKE